MKPVLILLTEATYKRLCDDANLIDTSYQALAARLVESLFDPNKKPLLSFKPIATGHNMNNWKPTYKAGDTVKLTYPTHTHRLYHHALMLVKTVNPHTTNGIICQTIDTQTDLICDDNELTIHPQLKGN